MGLHHVMYKPLVSVSPSISVVDAVRVMHEHEVGSTAVMEGPRLVGIFTVRDVAWKVMLKGMDPVQTPVSEVMSIEVKSVETRTSVGEALRIMLENHIHHLPVLNKEGEVKGVVSLQYLLRDSIEDLERDVASLDAYIRCDAPGG